MQLQQDGRIQNPVGRSGWTASTQVGERRLGAFEWCPVVSRKDCEAKRKQPGSPLGSFVETIEFALHLALLGGFRQEPTNSAAACSTGRAHPSTDGVREKGEGKDV